MSWLPNKPAIYTTQLEKMKTGRVIFHAQAYGLRFSLYRGLELELGSTGVHWPFNFLEVPEIFKRIKFGSNWLWWGLCVQVQRFDEEPPQWVWHIGPIFIHHRWDGKKHEDKGSHHAIRVR